MVLGVLVENAQAGGGVVAVKMQTGLYTDRGLRSLASCVGYFWLTTYRPLIGSGLSQGPCMAVHTGTVPVPDNARGDGHARAGEWGWQAHDHAEECSTR